MKAASTTIDQKNTAEGVDTPQTGVVITAEVALYAAILGVATVLRLWNLGAAPLSTREAAQAVAAFHGAPIPTGGSPLLFSINQVLFGLFSTTVNDSGVRLVAALIGSIMVLLPALFRSAIGRYGALAAALMLAVSPTLVAVSRSLDGAIVTAACTLAAIGFGLRYFTGQKRMDLIGLAISIGLGLTSGPGLVTIVLVLIPALLIVYYSIASEEDRAKVQQLRHEAHTLRDAVLIGGVTCILAATALFLRPDGLANVPESVSAWLGAWSAVDEIGALQLFQILIVYEPLIVLFGLAGLIMSLRRLTGLVMVLSVWTIGAFIIALLQPGRQVFDLALVLTPLALLGGLAIESLAHALEQHGAWKIEGLFWSVAAVVLGFAAINTAQTAISATTSASFLGMPLGVATSVSLSLVLLAVVFGGVFMLVIGWRATLRAATMMLFVLLAVISFSSAWNLAQMHAGNPRELLWGPTTTTLDVRAMREAIEAASKRQSGILNQAQVAVTLPKDDPVVRWYLRDFKNAQYNAVVSDLAPIIVAPQGSTFPPFVTDSYQGKPFVTQTLWEPSQLTDKDMLRWWLYRESDVAPLPAQSYVVWVKVNQE
ncbi:MAG TPA: glycosyltransferase family 39 protein [Anaerolineae bacterium]|nr:glycosyltransferase family 39 protein [Anaerolineae bacterium]